MRNVWSVVGSIDLPEKITIQNVLEVVCETMNVDINQVKGKKGTEELVSPRKLFGYFSCKYVVKAPLVAIGHAIGKDHSTIHHYRGAVEDMIFTKDKKYIQYIEDVDDKLLSMKWSNDYYSRNPQTVELNDIS